MSVSPGPAAQPATGSTESQPTTGRFATWRSGARNRVREVYAPIRVRLISLILLAAVPLVLLAATIA